MSANGKIDAENPPRPRADDGKIKPDPTCLADEDRWRSRRSVVVVRLVSVVVPVVAPLAVRRLPAADRHRLAGRSCRGGRHLFWRVVDREIRSGTSPTQRQIDQLISGRRARSKAPRFRVPNDVNITARLSFKTPHGSTAADSAHLRNCRRYVTGQLHQSDGSEPGHC